MSQETPSNFHEWFSLNDDVHQHNTTSNVEIIRENYFDVGTVSFGRALHTKQANLVNYGKKSLQVLGPLLWNDLPTELRKEERLNPFKYHCKAFYIDPSGQSIGNDRPNINIRRHPSGGHRSRLGNNTNLDRPFVSRWNQESLSPPLLDYIL